MVNVVSRCCVCDKGRAVFGEAGRTAVRCKHCKTPQMVNMKMKRCQCGKAFPNFGKAGGKVVCCKQCMTPGMIDVKNKRRRCGRAQPYFGEIGGKPLCCKHGVVYICYLTNALAITTLYGHRSVAWAGVLIEKRSN